MKIATERREAIPVYAEMRSISPVSLLDVLKNDAPPLPRRVDRAWRIDGAA